MKDKIGLRPTINKIADKENITPIEYFQNNTLRPIIKLQHQFLISFYSNYLLIRKTDFNTISNEKATEFIKSSLLNDNRLKNKLLGIVIGLFTIEELKIYLTNTSEINKRILGIIKQRLVDSLSELR